jgi:tRNA pseudouridine38-40 synthase
VQRVRLLLSYDGTDYCGWQRQKTSESDPRFKPSIQGTLEKALYQLTKEAVEVSASGRTDAGVHAVGQVAHFDTEKLLIKDLCWALRSQLPSSLVVKGAWLAPKEFHSMVSTQDKIYRYYVWNDSRPTALLARYSWWIRKPLDLKILQDLTNPLVGEHDFASFRSQGTWVRHTVRTIYEARWVQVHPRLFLFEVRGSGFLKQMVRNIVGTVIDAYLKGFSPQWVQKILQQRDRSQAGVASPPQGLFLYRVAYPKKLDRLCVKI